MRVCFVCACAFFLKIHYAYVCKKIIGADEFAERHWDEVMKEIEEEEAELGQEKDLDIFSSLRLCYIAATRNITGS